MVVALAKRRIASIVHIKNSFVGFPKDELDEKLRGMPGGSHLEMSTTIDGIKIMALGYKYNSKKTLFFCGPEGAAPTTEGVPYESKWPDEHRNVQTRLVPRPAFPARFFENFDGVDVHDHLRQKQLGLEMKWVTKGENSGKIRLHSTIYGMTAVDTMLALKCHSYPGHPIRSMTTKDFIEYLAEEMVDNELDGQKSRPSTRRRISMEPATSSPPPHQLAYYERNSGLSDGGRRRCVMCGAKAKSFCACSPGHPICAVPTRSCFSRHCAGETRTKKRKCEFGQATKVTKGRGAVAV